MFARVSCNSIRHLSSRVLVSDEVSAALHAGKGIVALESTVITHGLPYPKNLEVARTMEEVVRNEEATPATIALIDGCVQVGLSGTQLDRIASPESQTVKKLVGGTTVAATMWAAHQAGIRVFATGGIGGVHRGAEQTFDISADLVELGRVPVAVVCAGAKSILDIPKTLEFLETHGVNVIVYDKSNFFPGFFTPRTTNKAPFNSESITEIAEILRIQDEMGLRNGTLVACPLPEQLASEGRGIEEAIQQALEEARQKNIANKEVTPFLLSRISNC
ncbi:Protein T24C12.3 [Aphelenchoides avenae]|nr:Protein T24C12.3 [Aphelenchus avenae]